MTRRSRLPRAEGLDPAMVNYLDDLGRPIPAIADLGTGSTTTEIENKINEILEALRSSGKLES